MLPDVAELVESLHQISLHHGVAEPSDVDDRGRGDAVAVPRTVLQRQEKSLVSLVRHQVCLCFITEESFYFFFIRPCCFHFICNCDTLCL